MSANALTGPTFSICSESPSHILNFVLLIYLLSSHLDVCALKVSVTSLYLNAMPNQFRFQRRPLRQQWQRRRNNCVKGNKVLFLFGCSICRWRLLCALCVSPIDDFIQFASINQIDIEGLCVCKCFGARYRSHITYIKYLYRRIVTFLWFNVNVIM